MEKEQKRILENQEVIMLALSELLLPKCVESKNARDTNNALIDCYQETRRMLGKNYINRYTGIN